MRITVLWPQTLIQSFSLKRAVEPSILFGFWFQGFMVSWFHPNWDRDRYRDRLFNHGTHRTHGKAWLCFRMFSVFRGSHQKLRSAPNRCGANLNGSQCLRGFAQNLHAQLLFLGLVDCASDEVFRRSVLDDEAEGRSVPRGTAFTRRPATTLVLKKRRRAEYRLPPHSISFRLTYECRNGHKPRTKLAPRH